MEAVEQPGERFLRLGVDPGRRLVQDEQRGLAGECLGDERALLLAARERAHREVGAVGQSDALDRLGDDGAVAAAQRAEQPTGREPAGGDDLAHRRRSVDPELRALGEVAEGRAAGESRRGLAEEERLARRRPLEPERKAHQRRLAAAVRPGDRDELARFDGEVRRARARDCPRRRRTRRHAVRPLPASQRLPQRREVLAHDGEVVLSRRDLLLREAFERVEHGRLRADFAGHGLGESGRDAGSRRTWSSHRLPEPGGRRSRARVESARPPVRCP